MSQDETPLFGGMPARKHGDTAPQEPRRTNRLKRWGIVTASVVAVAAIALVIAPLVITNHGPEQTAAPELALSPEEIEAAEAAVAGGGGAIPGHIVSGELCAAIDAYMAAGSDDSVVESSPDLLVALDTLAAVESPNQALFQEYAAAMKDPATVTDLDAKQELFTDFADAVQVDVTTCL